MKVPSILKRGKKAAADANDVVGKVAKPKPSKAPGERPNAQDLANRDERNATYAAEQQAAHPGVQQSEKPDTSERARHLTMGQTPRE